MDNQEKNDFDYQKNNEKLIKKVNQNLKTSLKDYDAILEDHERPVKYSQIFHEFMKPIIDEVIHDEQSLTKMLEWGQYVWNKAVAEKFPEHPKSKDIEDLFLIFKLTYSDNNLIEAFIKRKNDYFYNNDFFIVKHAFILEKGGKLAISVAVLDLEK